MEGCPKISLVLSFMAAKPFSFAMHDNRVKERDDGYGRSHTIFGICRRFRAGTIMGL